MTETVITGDSQTFPETLRTISSPPKRLFYLGDISVVKRPLLSVVGSRKVTPYGRQVTTSLCEEVASKGVVIVSGLAFGVDSLAHEAALRSGTPTIAVLPAGLDTIYPASHSQLAKKIVNEGGLLITEYPHNTPALRQNFIARNRIVSGLSKAVLITEAAQRSGTLHTANFALEQGRVVMAIPGNITNPMSVGTNNLIKAGALPVTSSEDILLALGMDTRKLDIETMSANEQEAAIIALLKEGINEGNELLAASRLSTQEFNQTLTMMEITGKVYPLGAGKWSLK